MRVVIIKYKLHGKQYKCRVTYKNSANIVAGLLIAGAQVIAVGEPVVPKG